jgi:hypothetical protein
VALERHPHHRAVLGSAARSARRRDRAFYAYHSRRHLRSVLLTVSLLTARLNSQPARGARSLSSQRADAVDKLRRRQAGRADRPATPGSSFRSSDPCHGLPPFAALMARAFLSARSLCSQRGRGSTASSWPRINSSTNACAHASRSRSDRPIVDFGDYAASIPIRPRRVPVANGLSSVTAFRASWNGGWVGAGGLIYKVVWRAIAGDVVFVQEESSGCRDVGRADRSPTEASMFRKARPCETLRARSTRVARLSLGTWQRHPRDARITILY